MVTETLPRIKKLTIELANQIAAGEVIERPASVLKELLENSLDAGAKRIEVYLNEGGNELIKVRDNGVGISQEDLGLALAPHATSKIQKLEDLEQVRSLGFRGEALASISSVSKLCLISNTAKQEHAWQVSVAGRDRVPEIKPAAHGVGTTVEVQDLFFNTPARRKFLRSARAELYHIQEMFKRLVLSRFDCAFYCYEQERALWQLPVAKDMPAQTKRVEKIFGSLFIKHALLIEVTHHALRLQGWISDKTFSRSQADLQYFYVNGRIVRDKLINHAIRQAYQDYLPSGRSNAYVLFLELDPTEVDVNVHPTKQEVRFRENSLIHGFILQSVQQALEEEVVKVEEKSAFIPPVIPKTSVNYQANLEFFSKENLAVQQPLLPYKTEKTSATRTTPIIKGSLVPKVLGQAKACVHALYILAETTTGLVVVNIARAWRQIQYTKMQQNLAAGALHGQNLLVPASVVLNEAQQANLQEHQTVLEHLGFLIDMTGKERAWVRQALPALHEANFAELLPALLACMQATAYQQLYLKELSLYCEPNISNLQTILAMDMFLREVERYALEAQPAVYELISWQQVQSWFNDA